MSKLPHIRAVRSYLVEGNDGGDYFRQDRGNWLIDSIIANPMSIYPDYRQSRSSWGVDVMGSILVEIESADGTIGRATGFGGPVACWLIQHHFRRFLEGTDPREINRVWDQMYRASMPYGRKGIALATISVVDLALWDLNGLLREEPVYNLIGGRVRDEIQLYCTGPRPDAARDHGFWGGKVALPYGPGDGHSGLLSNVEYLSEKRHAVGDGFPLMVDCYMALDVPYAVDLAERCKSLDIYWWEECLHPDDTAGYALLKQAHPRLRWTTGEHEYTRYGFRQLIEGRNIDVLQPDVMWVGGLTELLRISAHAAAYDLPVVPHGSGPYSYHFTVTQPNSPYSEYVARSPDGTDVLPVFGKLFSDEQIPENGRIALSEAPGFGLTLNPAAQLTAFEDFQR